MIGARAFGAAGVAAILLASGMASVSAHGTFVDARPLPGVAVGGTIDEVEILFPEEIVIAGSRIEVRAPDGTQVRQRGPIGAPIPSLVRVGIQPLVVRGTYRIEYFVPSTDGTVFEGSFEFTYDPDADPLEGLAFGRGPNVLLASALAITALVGAAMVVSRTRGRTGGR
jgi:methionine-rich copper-binding protein CopC